MSYARSLLVTKVDANTKIYGGRFENIFQLAVDLQSSKPFKPTKSATFAGDIIGSTQTKVISFGSGFLGVIQKAVGLLKSSSPNVPIGRIPIVGTPVSNVIDLQYAPEENKSFFGVAKPGVSGNVANALKNAKNKVLAIVTLLKGGYLSNFRANLNTGNDLAPQTVTNFSGQRVGYTGGLTGMNDVAFGFGFQYIKGTPIISPFFGANTFQSGGGIPNPGISVLRGGTGGDTYAFSSIWGGSLILESPDIEVAGQDLEAFYDTLDFSSAGEIDFDIYKLSAVNVTETIGNELPAIANAFEGELTIPDGFDIDANFIVALSEISLPKSVDAFFQEADEDSYVTIPKSILAALDIETIISPSVANYVFHGDAEIQGAIRPFSLGGDFASNLLSLTDFGAILDLLTADPDTNLDYSNYNHPVVVDGDAGVEIPFGLSTVDLFESADEDDDDVYDPEFIGRVLSFGSATGINGNFSGLDAFLPSSISVGGKSISDFAVSNINDVIGSPFDDIISGNVHDNRIEGGQGNDTINGEGGDDILIGGLGSDIINGDNGDDTIEIVGVNQGDVINVDGGNGVDSLELDALVASGYVLKKDMSTPRTIFVEDNDGGLVATITYTNIDNQPEIERLLTNTLDAAMFSIGNGVNLSSVSELTPFIDEALRRWDGSGYNTLVPTNLGTISFEIADLPETVIGQTDGQTITLDVDAAGLGWFIDSTPEEDSEFSFTGNTGVADEESEAAGSLDLLTTIMHEFGHILGFEDIEGTGTLMSEILTTGVRLLPLAWTADSSASGLPVSGSMTGELSDRDAINTLVTEMAVWAANFESSITSIVNDAEGNPITLPFVNASLDSLFTTSGTEITIALNGILSSILTHLDTGNDFSRLADVSGVTATDNADEFIISVNLSNLLQILDMDLTSTSFGSFGLNFGKRGPPALELLSALNFTFNLGKDVNGSFFIRNPQLTADLTLAPTVVASSINTDQGGTVTQNSTGEFLYTPNPGFQGIETITYVLTDANSLVNQRTRTINVGFNEDTSEIGDFYVDVGSLDNALPLLEDPLNFELNLGPLCIEVQEGNLDFDTGVSVTAAGLFRTSEFAADTTGALIGSVEFDETSSYDLFFPIALETPFAGISLPLPGVITVFDLGQRNTDTLNEFFNDIDPFSFGIDDLLPFQNISLADIGNQVISAIDNIFGTITATEIPVIGKTIGDIIGSGSDIVEGIKSAINSAVDLAADIQSLPGLISDGIRDLLGVEDGFGLRIGDGILDVDLSFDSSSEFTFPLGLDLASLDSTIADALGLNTVGLGALDLSLGTITLEAAMNFNLGLSIDVNEGFSVTIDDSSGVGISFNTIESDIDGLSIDIPAITVGSISLPATTLGLVVENGTLDFNVDLDLGLADSDDGSHSLSEIGSALETSFNAGITAELPVFFPTSDSPLGGTTDDDNSDGFADNIIFFDATYEDGAFSNQFVAPNLGAQFAVGALFQNPKILADNLGSVLGDLNTKVQDAFDIDLPVIGDKLKENLSFFGDIKTGLADPLSAALTSFNGGISDAINLVESEVKSLIDGISGISLKNIGNTFKVRGLQAEFVLDLEGSTSTVLPLDFSASIPGLGLDIDTDITLELNYGFLLGFGFHYQDGFYVVTDSQLNSGREFFLELSATISDGSELSGTLGFLNLSLTEEEDGEDSGLRASIGIDVSDPSGDGRLTTSEFSSIGFTPLFDGDLATSFGFVASIPPFDILGQSFNFPEIDAKLFLEQEFPSLGLSELTSGIFEDLPVPFFDDIGLDLGGFIGEFMFPIASWVADTLDPIRPVVELLTFEIPVLTLFGLDNPTLLGLAEISGGAVASAITAINSLGEALSFADTIKDLKDTLGDQPLRLSVGSFVAGGVSKGSTAGGGTVGGGSGLSSLSGAQSQLNGNDSLSGDQKQKLGNTFSKVGKSKTTGALKFQFDLLTNPGNIFNLLLGNDANLFTLDLPPLELAFQYIQSFPIPGLPGLNARLGGRVSAQTRFGFGIDTTGFNAWKSQDFDPFQIGLLLDSFFISDNGIEGTANDKAEVRLSAAIIAGASVGIPGVEAGVDGGIEAAIDFDLRDEVDPVTGQGDGEIRLSELASLLEDGGFNPFCLFNTRGQLAVFLEAFMSISAGPVTIFELRQRFVDAVIATFEFDFCDEGSPPDIAQLDNGVLTL